jgi:muramoyltetrapeptide carboxypeptidase
MFRRERFFAGSDERRRDEMQLAIDDPDISAIVIARGGWGAARFVTSIDFRSLVSHPKWIVGFSDPTTLHIHAWQIGVASMHANNFVSLGRSDASARKSWLDALEFPDKFRVLRGQTLCSGNISGTLVGGNLTILFTTLAMGRLHFPDNCILALEDIDEPSYRIDRMLCALRNSGALDRVAAYALGQFVNCDSGRHGIPVSCVLENHMKHLDVPVVVNLPFGHGRINEPLPFGICATLDGSRGELRLGEHPGPRFHSSSSESSTEMPSASTSSTSLGGGCGAAGAGGRAGLDRGACTLVGFKDGGGGGVRTPDSPRLGGTESGGRALVRVGGAGGGRRTGPVAGGAIAEGGCPDGEGAMTDECCRDFAGA